jgi:hypothetical protein
MLYVVLAWIGDSGGGQEPGGTPEPVFGNLFYLARVQLPSDK